MCQQPETSFKRKFNNIYETIITFDLFRKIFIKKVPYIIRNIKNLKLKRSFSKQIYMFMKLKMIEWFRFLQFTD